MLHVLDDGVDLAKARLPTDIQVCVYTDFKLPVHACGEHASRSHTVFEIKARASIIDQGAHALVIRSIPERKGIPGNEVAHQGVRELLCSPTNDPGAEQPSHEDEDNEDLDCPEAASYLQDREKGDTIKLPTRG